MMGAPASWAAWYNDVLLTILPRSAYGSSQMTVVRSQQLGVLRQQQRVRISGGDQNRASADLFCVADEEIEQRLGIIAQVITRDFDGVTRILERIVTSE